MNEEAQRIAIAEACGWKWSEDVHGNPILIHKELNLWGATRVPEYVIFGDLPDYLNDLNAMHEAEKVLDDTQRRKFGEVLQAVSLTAFRFAGDEALDRFDLLHATAKQRAGAFLRTIGMWEEHQ